MHVIYSPTNFITKFNLVRKTQGVILGKMPLASFFFTLALNYLTKKKCVYQIRKYWTVHVTHFFYDIG
jgi:hypothetical protein